MFKVDDSLIQLPAYLVSISFIAMMLMVVVSPWFLLVAIPLVLTFIGGIIMENIYLEFESNLIQKDPSEIDITNEEE